MRAFALALAMLLLAGCASVAGVARQPETVVDPAASRGRDFAVTHCSGCHEIGLAGSSHYAAAPAFRSLRRPWDGVSLQLRLERSPVHGRGADMPTRPLTAAEADDLAAYIRLTAAGKAVGQAGYTRAICQPIFWC